LKRGQKPVDASDASHISASPVLERNRTCQTNRFKFFAPRARAAFGSTLAPHC
jgi:hypothetical protein